MNLWFLSILFVALMLILGTGTIYAFTNMFLRRMESKRHGKVAGVIMACEDGIAIIFWPRIEKPVQLEILKMIHQYECEELSTGAYKFKEDECE